MVAAQVLSPSPLARPRFDRAVAPGGYQWHYLDGVSDDGSLGVVIIALVGNPFSPAYAASPKAPATRFCAMNVAVYGRGAKRWALTERAIDERDREPDALAIGSSSIEWRGGDLVAELDEVTSPFPSPRRERVRGRVRICPEGDPAGRFGLDAAGEHTWIPWSPLASIEVELDEPRVRFRGHGYHDVNHGDGRLDEAFSRWSWSRGRVGRRAAVLTYDAIRRDGTTTNLGFTVDDRGRREPLPRTMLAPLPVTRWGLSRAARSDVFHVPRVAWDLEDTPFYARALVRSRLGGHATTVVHEELSADRLRASWVRFLLGFRMKTARP